MAQVVSAASRGAAAEHVHRVGRRSLSVMLRASAVTGRPCGVVLEEHRSALVAAADGGEVKRAGPPPEVTIRARVAP